MFGCRFSQPVGAAADVKELEYIIALHQTSKETRSNATISSQDVKSLLKSRYSLDISHDQAVQVVQALGGGDGVPEQPGVSQTTTTTTSRHSSQPQSPTSAAERYFPIATATAKGTYHQLDQWWSLAVQGIQKAPFRNPPSFAAVDPSNAAAATEHGGSTTTDAAHGHASYSHESMTDNQEQNQIERHHDATTSLQVTTNSLSHDEWDRIQGAPSTSPTLSIPLTASTLSTANDDDHDDNNNNNNNNNHNTVPLNKLMGQLSTLHAANQLGSIDDGSLRLLQDAITQELQEQVVRHSRSILSTTPLSFVGAAASQTRSQARHELQVVAPTTVSTTLETVRTASTTNEQQQQQQFAEPSEGEPETWTGRATGFPQVETVADDEEEMDPERTAVSVHDPDDDENDWNALQQQNGSTEPNGPSPQPSGPVEEEPQETNHRKPGSDRSDSAPYPERETVPQFLDLVQVLTTIMTPTLARLAQEAQDNVPAPEPKPKNRFLIVSRLLEFGRRKLHIPNYQQDSDQYSSRQIVEMARTALLKSFTVQAPVVDESLVQLLLVSHGEIERAVNRELVQEMVAAAQSPSGCLDLEALIQAISYDLNDCWDPTNENLPSTFFYDVFRERVPCHTTQLVATTTKDDKDDDNNNSNKDAERMAHSLQPIDEEEALEPIPNDPKTTTTRHGFFQKNGSRFSRGKRKQDKPDFNTKLSALDFVVDTQLSLTSVSLTILFFILKYVLESASAVLLRGAGVWSNNSFGLPFAIQHRCVVSKTGSVATGVSRLVPLILFVPNSFQWEIYLRIY